jgi:MFS family permease
MTQTLARAQTSPGALTGKRAGSVLAVILIGQFMAVLDSSIVNVAIPSVRTPPHASGSALQLVVSGYVIAYAVLLVTGARLGDRLGQRTAFIAGLAGFTVASLACGLAWNSASLIGFRVAQGASAALMVPQVMTTIQRTFTGAARARALSAYAAVISGGMAVGQVLGGFIVSADLDGSRWRGVFLVNVPIGAVLLAPAVRLLPPTGRVRRKLDLAGLSLLTPSVLLLVLPLVLGHQQNWPLWTWLALAAGVVGFVGFLAMERLVHRRGGEPLFADAVLRAPGLVLAAATMFLVMATFSGWLFALTIHLQTTLRYSASHAGLLFIPTSVAFALASLNWERIPRQVHAVMIPLGLLVGAGTMALLGLRLGDGRGVGAVELSLFAVNGAGFGLAFSPLMNKALGKVPLPLAADASGILVTGVQLGIVVGVAGLGSLFLSLVGRDADPAHAFTVTAFAGAGAVLLAAVAAGRAARSR